MLSVFSKVFEKFMKNRLVCFSDGLKVFKENQYGFSNGKSTEDALTEVPSFIYSIACDARNYRFESRPTRYFLLVPPCLSRTERYRFESRHHRYILSVPSPFTLYRTSALSYSLFYFSVQVNITYGDGQSTKKTKRIAVFNLKNPPLI